MDEFRNKQTGMVIEAMQVPIKQENEAEKDLEQRYAKVCAWLIDQKNILEVDFTTGVELSYWLEISKVDRKWFDVSPGSWLYQNSAFGVTYYHNDEAFYKEWEQI